MFAATHSLADLLILFLALAVLLCVCTSIPVLCPDLSALFATLAYAAGCVAKIPILELTSRPITTALPLFFSTTYALPILQLLSFDIDRVRALIPLLFFDFQLSI